MMPGPNELPDHDHQSEIRLMGLILVQAVCIGMGVGIFDAEFWIVLESPAMNGVTYAMAAFAVQGLAYYFFKMFFQQGMDEKARHAGQERERRTRYRSMEHTFDRRRQDMEMRMQEAQLEAELVWMEKNPGQTPPWVEARMYGAGTGTMDFTPQLEEADVIPLSLGVDFGAEKESDSPKRASDGKFTKKE
jgi:hypothetical protein